MVIEAAQRPALIISHNKTLSAQLYHEFRDFFPENAVEYFVSYYDYYQPEAYVPSRDLYIEKDSSINEEIDRMRLSATRSLMERKDVIIVATVSCIYGLATPEIYREMSLRLGVGRGDRPRRGKAPPSSPCSTSGTTRCSSAGASASAAMSSRSTRPT